jgi:hypothetical protein
MIVFVETPTPTPTQTPTPTPPGYTPQSYVGYCEVTGNLADDKECAYNSTQSGTLYYSNGYYYQDTSLTILADNGIYCTYKGVEGYPEYTDSEFFIINY